MPAKQPTKHPNLYLREGIWWARFEVKGVEWRRSLRTRFERVALKRLAAMREEIEDEALFGIAGPVAWADAVVGWSQAKAPAIGERTFQRYVCSLRQLRTHLDALAVHQVTSDVVKEIIRARRRGGAANATIRRDLTALSSVLDNAADEGWIAENPVPALNRRRIVPERTARIVLPQEASIALLFARLPDRLRALCEFTRETGLRLEEATSLRHQDLDRDERTMTVVVGKGDKTRVVPLTAAAEEIMDRQPRYIGKPFVFWRGKGLKLRNVSSRIGGYVRRAARRAARDKVDFEPLNHHGFRHLFAVEYLRRRRGSIYDLQGELGHGSIGVTERYLDFLTPEQARTAKSTVSQLGAHEQRSEATSAA